MFGVIKKNFKKNYELYISVFLVQIGLGVVGPVLNDIKNFYALESTAKTSLIISSFAFARLICDIPISFFIQKFKQEKILAFGTMFVLVGSIMVALASSYNSLLIGRMIAGAGSAVTVIAAVVILNSNSTLENRGTTLATHQAFFLGGVSIGPAIGGVVASVYGWRGAFWSASIAALFAFGFSINLLRKSKIESSSIKADGHGTEKVSLSSRKFWVYITVANLSTFILFFALESYNNTIIPLYGSLELGLDAGVLGLIIGFVAIMRFFSSFFGGILSDKFGRSSILIPSLIVAGIGTISIRYAVNIFIYIFVIMIFAVGRMGNNVNSAILGDITPPQKIGYVIGFNRFIADVGLTVGPLFLGLVVDLWGFNTAGLVVGLSSWFIAFVIFKVFGIGIVKTVQS